MASSIRNKITKGAMGEKIYSWIFFQSILIIIATIISFLVVEIGSRVMESEAINWNAFFRSLGIIIPMCVLLGMLNTYLFRTTYKYITNLSEAMGKVADGNFKVRVDTSKSGPFTILYENFNKMGNELENVQSLKSDFINNYSHEFKTPITSIKGFADLLLEESITENDKKEYLKIISEESSRLANLADSTLLMSKLENQYIIENKKEYSLDNQIEECATMLSREWKKKNIDFTGEFQEVMYNGNKEIMKQLWINLLSNSLKYTPKNGKVIVRLKQRNSEIIVSIKDTGIGMNKESVAHIFDKYYQGDTSHSTPGLGLGLSIVKRIVELCDGTINVESIENVGSTFVILLPNK